MLNSRRNRNLVRSATRPVIECLEGRQMLSASLAHNGSLYVNGTAHADAITVTMDAQDATLIDVSVNGKVKTFAASAVKKIVINGAGGNDTITVDSSILTPTTILGGAGSDSLTAGGGADSLNGGAGNDSLAAGAGDDTLLGGAGNDSLVGGTGDDAMDGGAGNDSLQGGAGNCTLHGGLGNDTLMGGTGTDSVDAGKGKDSVEFNPYGGVALDTLPAAVQTGLMTLAHGATINSVLIFQENGQTFYGTEVILDGEATNILVDANGNPPTKPSSPSGQGSNGNSGDNGKNTNNNDSTQGQHYASGTIVSIDTGADTITVASDGGVDTTYNVTSQTVVYLNGAVSTLSAMTPGAKVSLAIAADGTSVIAMGISTTDNSGGGGEAQATYVTGTIVSVDTTADTLSFSSNGVTTSYTFSSATTVYLNGTASTLAALTAGAAAGLKIAPDGTTIIVAGVETPNNSGGGGDQNPTPPPATHLYASGTVVSTDTAAKTVTVVKDGVDATYDLNDQSIIYINHLASPLSAITAGENLSIELAADGTTVVVMGTSTQNNSGGGGTTVAQNTYVGGTIMSLDATANTLTFKNTDGVTTTYAITNATVIYMNGAISTIASVMAGDAATIELAPDGTTLLAIGAETPTPPPTPPSNPLYASGTVVSVDTGANTVTVSNNGVNATYTITSQSIIYINHVSSPLSAIVAGEKLSIELASDGVTVIVMGTSTQSTTAST